MIVSKASYSLGCVSRPWFRNFLREFVLIWCRGCFPGYQHLWSVEWLDRFFRVWSCSYLRRETWLSSSISISHQLPRWNISKILYSSAGSLWAVLAQVTVLSRIQAFLRIWRLKLTNKQHLWAHSKRYPISRTEKSLKSSGAGLLIASIHEINQSMSHESQFLPCMHSITRSPKKPEIKYCSSTVKVRRTLLIIWGSKSRAFCQGTMFKPGSSL